MSTVSVNSPKTPVTKGSNGLAPATVPNVCKMPGPPAPFVPVPLPNIGKSGNSPQGYSTRVTVEGMPVAIRGASFASLGDVASKGTGGGIVSSNVEGPTTFLAPGSMDVQIEGKNVQTLGDQMLNNGGPSGSPPNAATLAGELQAPGQMGAENRLKIECADAPKESGEKFTSCEKKQICAKCGELNRDPNKLGRAEMSEELKKERRESGNAAAKSFKRRLCHKLKRNGGKKGPELEKLIALFHHRCAYDEWKKDAQEQENPTLSGLSADHVHEIQLGGSPVDDSNLKMMSSRANSWLGSTLRGYHPGEHSGVAPDCCGPEGSS